METADKAGSDLATRRMRHLIGVSIGLLVVSVLWLGVLHQRREERAREDCSRDFMRNTRALEAEAAACADQGGRFVYTAKPSMVWCGAGAGFCGK